MAVALVEPDRIGRQRVFIEPLGLALVAAADDRDLALVADERRAAAHPWIKRAECDHDAARIAVVDHGVESDCVAVIALAGQVLDELAELFGRFDPHLDGAALVHPQRPLHHAQAMTAPVQ